MKQKAQQSRQTGAVAMHPLYSIIHLLSDCLSSFADRSLTNFVMNQLFQKLESSGSPSVKQSWC